MKKTILFLFLLFTAGFATVSAQSLMLAADTVTGNLMQSSANNFHNTLTTNSTADVPYQIRVVSHNLPAAWLDNNGSTGLCAFDCYTAGIFTGGGWNSGGTLNSSANQDIKLTVDASSGNFSASRYYVTVQLRPNSNPSAVSQTTFLLNRPNAITNVVRGDVINAMYPNPARESLNVLFDENAGVHSVAVYSLLGRPVKVYKVAGSSARLDIGDVPSGVYFLRLMNSQGSVLSTRRFNHQ